MCSSDLVAQGFGVVIFGALRFGADFVGFDLRRRSLVDGFDVNDDLFARFFAAHGGFFHGCHEVSLVIMRLDGMVVAVDDFVSVSHRQRREQEGEVQKDLPLDFLCRYRAGVNEGLQQVDGGDADNRHREFD